jgi:hypothetical protein
MRQGYREGTVWKIPLRWGEDMLLVQCEWDQVFEEGEHPSGDNVAKLDEFRRHCESTPDHMPAVVKIEQSTQQHCFYFCLSRTEDDALLEELERMPDGEEFLKQLRQMGEDRN